MSKPLADRAVLVVEDDYFIADEMRRALEDGGARVLGPVGDVEDALALIVGAARIDAAVLDVNLHDGTVSPVADALAERGVPFVFTTGYDRAALPERHAAVRRLEKPVAPSAVLREVGRLLGAAD